MENKEKIVENLKEAERHTDVAIEAIHMAWLNMILGDNWDDETAKEMAKDLEKIKRTLQRCALKTFTIATRKIK